MPKEFCSNCNTKMTQRVSFCPVCSRPTPHASDAEHLEWDLGQWRQHVDRSVASGQGTASPVALSSVAVAPERVAPLEPFAPVRPVARPAPVVQRTPRAEKAEPSPKASKPPRARRLGIPKPRLRLPVVSRSAPEDRVIVLDADHAFVYTACTSCERSDWILRTSRNEDETYNYWCVRCSRSFKTDARLRHGLKPFVAGGSVIFALASLSVVMR